MAKLTPRVEPDSIFFLKILMYFILGTIWIKINSRPVIPVGFILGILFSMHDHFRIDRKIEYVVLLFAMVLGFLGLGFFLAINY